MGDESYHSLLERTLIEMVRHRTQALLEMLISALDCRDSGTGWHSRRVSLYARRLAQQLGIAELELSVVEHGALLHDIGKIAIVDAVLLKPGPLDPEDWALMKQCPELGWKILQVVEWLRPASEIVRQHQERWDGGGYPGGLNGEQIVIGARILHVVDTLDAITTDRPYRKARPFADARAEIIRCRGAQFDPRVVDAFLAVPPAEWDLIRVDLETVAGFAADLAERPPSIPDREDRLTPRPQ